MVRLRQEISMLGGSSRLEELEKRLSACLSQNHDVINIDEKQVISPTKLRVVGNELSFFQLYLS